jgi:hypothetical protein
MVQIRSRASRASIRAAGLSISGPSARAWCRFCESAFSSCRRRSSTRSGESARVGSAAARHRPGRARRFHHRGTPGKSPSHDIGGVSRASGSTGQRPRAMRRRHARAESRRHCHVPCRSIEARHRRSHRCGDCARHQVKSVPLSAFSIRPLKPGSLVLGYSGYETTSIRTAASQLCTAMRSMRALAGTDKDGLARRPIRGTCGQVFLSRFRRSPGDNVGGGLGQVRW